MNHKKFSLVLLGMLLLAVIAGCAPAGDAEEMPTAALPVNKAFADGKEIYFVHLEASDENAAQQMTEMMDSPTLYVPSLAKVPAEALANVYSFNNGAEGQDSVCDNPPGMEGYTPLRQLNMVVWADGKTPRVLKSVAEINAAKDAGEVSIVPTGIVVNMPFVVWDGGMR
jgi:hypothetical protein